MSGGRAGARMRAAGGRGPGGGVPLRLHAKPAAASSRPGGLLRAAGGSRYWVLLRTAAALRLHGLQARRPSPWQPCPRGALSRTPSTWSSRHCARRQLSKQLPRSCPACRLAPGCCPSAWSGVWCVRSCRRRALAGSAPEQQQRAVMQVVSLNRAGAGAGCFYVCGEGVW